MASANFTFQDAMDAVRAQLNDAAQRRWKDVDVQTLWMPRVYQKLRSARPDGFVGFGAMDTVNFKPSMTDPLPFADELFDTFVEMLLAAVMEQSNEATTAGSAGAADSRAERSRQE